MKAVITLRNTSVQGLLVPEAESSVFFRDPNEIVVALTYLNPRDGQCIDGFLAPAMKKLRAGGTMTWKIDLRVPITWDGISPHSAVIFGRAVWPVGRTVLRAIAGFGDQEPGWRENSEIGARFFRWRKLLQVVKPVQVEVPPEGTLIREEWISDGAPANKKPHLRSR